MSKIEENSFESEENSLKKQVFIPKNNNKNENNIIQVKSLICDNYTSGAVCCYPFRNGKNMKTLIYLVQKQ